MNIGVQVDIEALFNVVVTEPSLKDKDISLGRFVHIAYVLMTKKADDYEIIEAPQMSNQGTDHCRLG